MQGHVQGRQYQSDSAEQLDQDVERWACRILKRVTNGVTDDAGLVGFALLAQNGAVWIEAIYHLTFSIHAQVSGFDILFRVVPRAAPVVEEERQDNKGGDEEGDIGQVNSVDARNRFVAVQYIQVRAKEQECCERRRANTVALCQSLSGITDAIQRVGDVTYRLCLTTHLGDAASIVGDRAKCIHSENIGSTHEHAHCGNGGTKDTSCANNPVKSQIHLTTEEVGETERAANSEHGKSDAFESHCHTCNNRR